MAINAITPTAAATVGGPKMPMVAIMKFDSHMKSKSPNGDPTANIRAQIAALLQVLRGAGE